jgi:predicted nuclease of predicted toxin-antitoxin system
MNISPLTVLQLKGRGWNITRVSEVMDKSTKDLDLLEYARRHDMVIITQDLDFSMLLAVKGFGKPSLVNVRLEEAKPAYVTSRIIDTVSALEPELAKGAVVTVDEASLRYRYLPIRTEIASASEK